MAPPLPVTPLRTPSTKSPEIGTSTTWSGRVPLKPTRFYPPMPFHLFPEDHFNTQNHADFTPGTVGSVSPLAIQIISVLVVGFVLFVTLCCTRFHLKKRLRKFQIKGDINDKQPSWTEQTCVISPPYMNVSWHRKNMGGHVTLLSSRCIYVDLKRHFAASARPDAQGQRLSNSHDVTLTFEGAMSDIGFTSGRHAIAFMWPRDQRYSPDAYLAFGLGYPSLDLRGSDESIIGGNRKSMAFDVIKNELFFNYAKISDYPRKKPKDFCVPTLFYMYMNLDQGHLSFSSENEYWGTAFDFSNMRKNPKKPLHVMVSFRAIRGKIMMFYKGQVPDYEKLKDDDSIISEDSGIECNKLPVISPVTDSESNYHRYTFQNPGFLADEKDPSENFHVSNSESLAITDDGMALDKDNLTSILRDETNSHSIQATELDDIQPQIMNFSAYPKY